MHKQRGLALLAYAAALAACPGAGSPIHTTEDTSTASAGSSGATSDAGASSTADDPGPTEPGSSSTGSSAGTTETGATDTGATETGATETGSTDTGAADCEPIWAVPEVAADELAAHDLQWIGCGFTACGPEDSPPPGEPSLLCDDVAIADAPLTYLGQMHPDESGAFSTDDAVAAGGIAWLDSPRHIYRYAEDIYIMTEADDAVAQLEVYYTARALEILRTDHPAVYERLVVEPGEYAQEPTLDGLGWKNRLRALVISYDTSPLYIAAGVTVLDAAPVATMGVDAYSNTAAISIDRETILGASEEVGTRPVYGEPSDDANLLRYLREGLAETLVHELLHTRVDRLNSVDARMNELYFRRTDPFACARFALEEALVAASSLLHFREAGGLSDAYLDYYDAVLDANLAAVEACPEYPTWAGQYAAPSGVHARYDLRLHPLE